MYLLKDRAHVPDIIKTFFNEIKTQFSASPKIFRTDNALGFVQSEIVDFCTFLGILHQPTRPHTSQQNEVTKKKHHHILNVTRTLMI